MYNKDMSSIEEQVDAAAKAGTEELWRLIRGQHPAVMSRAVLNGNLTEQMAVFIAGSRRVSPEVLGTLANDFRFKDSERLKLAICKNPKAPRKITLSLLKFLKIFDLADMSRDQQVDIAVRQKIEHVFSEKMPSLPSGVKTALARRASSTIVLSLMERGDRKVTGVCLDSPVLAEAHIYALINRQTTKGAVIKMIADHEKWSLRYSVKFALIRNYYTPMAQVAKFIRAMKIADLKDLYADPKVPLSTRPFIYRELLDRGQNPEIPKEEVFILADDEDPSIPGEETGHE
jgi:hypothetical protein